ncbi:MAG: hypothetical protein C0404_06225 [Verrucomicrobia bacterium]|nr:hypothetical protein [Verrucomicrobiota bacterium]
MTGTYRLMDGAPRRTGLAMWVYFLGAAVFSSFVSYPVLAQGPTRLPGLPAPVVPGRPTAAAANTVQEAKYELKFKNGSTLDVVLKDYSDKTRRTILQGPGVPLTQQIVLESQTPLTLDEYLDAEEAVMGMYGIGVIKVGEKFLKVVPIATVRTEPMGIQDALPADGQLKESDALISQMIPLKHIDTAEALKAVTPFKHSYGNVLQLERSNSILVTDSAATINRIMQMLKYVDVPLDVSEEPLIFQIQFTKASVIKGKLEEIIAEYTKEQKSTVARPNPSGAPGMMTTPVATPPGLPIIRPPLPPSTTVVGSLADIAEAADRGIIRGKVKIVADDRTNKLIIITRKENVAFFNQMLTVLDVRMDPDVVVNVIRLEYAEADDIGGTLNTLIGQVDKTKQVAGGAGSPNPSGQPGVVTPGAPVAPTPDSGVALREYVDRIERGLAASSQKDKSKIGELSASNIKILSDKRTNSLIIMSSKADFEQIKELVTKMDVMLAQVLIESVIVQIDLDDTLTSGIHWIQRALVAYDNTPDGGRAAKASWAASAGGGRSDTLTASTLNTIGGWGTGAGLTTYFTHFGLNLDAIVKLMKTDSRSHVLSSPIVVTTDNKEANITSTEEKYYLKGNTVDQFGNVRPDVGTKQVGLTLKVKPQINEKGNVYMEISQKVSEPGGEQKIGDQSWPTTKERSFDTKIAVRSKETIILGGLVRGSTGKASSRVPILGSIPLLGKLFSSQTDTGAKSEIVVFITPYVLDSPEAIAAESARRKDSMSLTGVWKRDWSDSKLADPADASIEHSTRKTPPEAPAVKLPVKEPVKVQIDTREPQPVVPVRRTPAEPVAVKNEVKPVNDPMANLDPELVKFMERQEKRYEKAIKKVDKQVDKQIAEDEAAKGRPE